MRAPVDHSFSVVVSFGGTRLHIVNFFAPKRTTTNDQLLPTLELLLYGRADENEAMCEISRAAARYLHPRVYMALAWLMFLHLSKADRFQSSPERRRNHAARHVTDSAAMLSVVTA